MCETTDNIAGVKVFGVTNAQTEDIKSALESAGVGPVRVPDTSHAPRLEATTHTCITGRCYPGGNCFAKVARIVLQAIPAEQYNIHRCLGGPCNKED